jgi:hypothetical protein
MKKSNDRKPAVVVYSVMGCHGGNARTAVLLPPFTIEAGVQ